MTIYDPPLTLAQATAPLSRTTIEAKLYEIYDALNIDRSHWVAGYVMEGFTRGAAIILAGMSSLTADVAKAPYLSLASTTWLRLKAFYDYSTEYLQATQAAGQVTLTNNSVSLVTALANAVVVSHSVSGKTYRINQAISVAPNGGTQVRTIVAVESGSASNAAPNTITQFVTPLTGVTVNNLASVVGRDDETNSELIQRSRENVATWSPNNPRGAYAAILKAARRSSDGTLIGVTRTRSVPDGFGNVITYVASASGAITNPADLLDLNTVVQTFVEPEAVNATVVSAAPTNIALTATIYTDGSKTNTFITNAVNDAILALAASQDIGGVRLSGTGYVYKADIIQALMNADSSIYNVVVSAPVGDTVILVLNYPVFSPVSLTVLSS